MKWLSRRAIDAAAADRDAMRKPIRAAGMQLVLTTLAARHAAEFGSVLVPPMLEAAARMLWTSQHVRTIYDSVESLASDLDNTLMAPGGTQWRAHVVRGRADEPFDGDALMRCAHEARRKVIGVHPHTRIRGARFQR